MNCVPRDAEKAFGYIFDISVHFIVRLLRPESFYLYRLSFPLWLLLRGSNPSRFVNISAGTSLLLR